MRTLLGIARRRARRDGSAAAAAAACRWRRRARPSAPAAAAPACLPVRAKASNRIGAAAVRPRRPGTGAPSGRPTQTPMVRRAVEADRPGVAIAVGGAGLEGDAAARGVLRRRRADQHIADIPGGDRIEQPARRPRQRQHRPRVRSAGRSCRAAPARHRACVRSVSVTPTPPSPIASPGTSPLGSTSVAAGLREPRRQPRGADPVEHRHRRHVERQLQRLAHRHRALEGEIEILRRVVAVADRPVVDQRLGMDEAVLESRARR